MAVVVVSFVFSSGIPLVRQHTLKGFVLLDEVASLFIALTGISFEILPPSTSLLLLSWSSSGLSFHSGSSFSFSFSSGAWF